MAKKKQQNKFIEKWLRVIVFLILIAIVSVSITLTMYTTFSVKETETIPYYFIVQDKLVGIDTNTSPLSFGGMPPGGTGKREITLTSSSPVRVLITAEGEGSAYIYSSENNFILLPGEERLLTVYAGPSLDAEEKRYEGELRIFFIRPRFGTNIQGVPEGSP